MEVPEEVPKTRGNMRERRGLQPGRQPQAIPTLASIDITVYTLAACPGKNNQCLI
jgi:hypothetical protein